MKANVRLGDLKKACGIAASVVTLLLSAAVHAQVSAAESEQAQPEARVPARPLPAQMAGILLQEGRELLEHPDQIVDRMELSDGDIVADVGCGPGYYSLRLAERIAPSGVVFAVDIQQGMLDQLEDRMTTAGVRNVYPVLGDFTDPYLPEGKVDWILLVDAYHEFGEPEAMLEKMRASLAPGGRVALLEYRAEQDPATLGFPIPRDHKMSIDEVMGEWETAGFELIELLEFLPAQHYFIFGKKGDDEAVQEAQADRADRTAWHERAEISSLSLGSVSNLTTLGGYVYFSGQPAEGDLRLFADRGVKTVINLRTPEEMETLGFDEKAAAEAAGMTYVNKPLGRGHNLSDADLKEIAGILAGASEGRVLLHCASSNRVGHVWSLFRAMEHGADADQAIEDGESAGMRSAALQDAARTRIESMKTEQ